MSSNETYTLILQNSKKKTYSIMSLALIIMNALAFLWFLFFDSLYKTGIAGLVVILIYFLIKRWEQKKNPEVAGIDENVFFLMAVVWVSQNLYVAILLIAIGIMLKLSLQKFRFIFSEEKIQKDFFPVKTYEWSSIDSVILKSGILTINFKNNNLIQERLEDPSGTDEKAFNEFISIQLEKERGTDL